MIESWKLNALWAKKPRYGQQDDPDDIVSLQTHLMETADVAKRLWESWLPRRLQEQLDMRLLIFLAYVHDIGKASPAFQTKEGFGTPNTDEKIYAGLKRAGYVIKEYAVKSKNKNPTPHALVSFGILRRKGFDDSVSVIVGGHHGKPPTKDQLNDINAYGSNCGFDEETWRQAQDALLEEALAISGLTGDFWHLRSGVAEFILLCRLKQHQTLCSQELKSGLSVLMIKMVR